VGIVIASNKEHFVTVKETNTKGHKIMVSVTSLPLHRHKKCTGYFVTFTNGNNSVSPLNFFTVMGQN
jgi:hypothetical protein